MENPDTRWTWNDDLAIAYQVTGNGPDLLYLPQFLSNVVWNWHVPEHARFLRRLSSFSRLIIMDPRGTGASDGRGPDRVGSLEEKVDDVLAVLSATMSFRSVLFGGGRSAFVAMLAAATHPDRFSGLILFAATPTWMRSDDLPWQDQDEELERIAEQTQRSTSSMDWATSWAGSYAPSLPTSSYRAIADYGALTAGTGTQLAEQLLLGRVDLRPLLPTITVPTLVLHRVDDPLESIESGRYLASKIPDAKLVELPGADALPWIGDAESVLGEIEMFLNGERRTPAPDRSVATVVFTDIVDSTARSASMGHAAWREIQTEHDRIVREEIARCGGREVKTMGDGFLATFTGPARAIECAVEIVRRTLELDIQVRAGVHTGEVELDGDDVAGLGVAIGARVGALAPPAEVLVSQTVRDLVAGSGLEFADAGEHELKGVPDRWRLFRVVT